MFVIVPKFPDVPEPPGRDCFVPGNFLSVSWCQTIAPFPRQTSPKTTSHKHPKHHGDGPPFLPRLPHSPISLPYLPPWAQTTPILSRSRLPRALVATTPSLPPSPSIWNARYWSDDWIPLLVHERFPIGTSKMVAWKKDRYFWKKWDIRRVWDH